jgi:hypothetical protein
MKMLQQGLNFSYSLGGFLLLYMIMCCDFLIIDDLCNEICEVEDTSEVHEKSTPLPTINGLHTYNFKWSILLCGLCNFLYHKINCIFKLP